MKTQSSKVIDVEFLRSIIDNDREFEKELLTIFLENANRNMVKMEEAVNSGDNNAWYMSSHAFKGASASIGAFRLSQMLEYAQKHPDDNSDNIKRHPNNGEKKINRGLKNGWSCFKI
jgi:HPt (histidine-containing phosphotransfer) domain-containing protein